MNLKQRARLGWIALIAFAADRAVKALCVSALAGGDICVIENGLSLHLIRNSGVAFSMMSGNVIVTVLLTAIVLAGVLIYLLKHTETDTVTRAGLWLILGGGIGNLYDRILYGSVIDFIRVDLFRFAIFNTADIFVCIGCAMAVIANIINDCKERKNRGI